MPAGRRERLQARRERQQTRRQPHGINQNERQPGTSFLFGPLGEQICHQIVKILFGYGIDEIGGHGRQQ